MQRTILCNITTTLFYHKSQVLSIKPRGVSINMMQYGAIFIENPLCYLYAMGDLLGIAFMIHFCNPLLKISPSTSYKHYGFALSKLSLIISDQDLNPKTNILLKYSCIASTFILKIKASSFLSSMMRE